MAKFYISIYIAAVLLLIITESSSTRLLMVNKQPKKKQILEIYFQVYWSDTTNKMIRRSGMDGKVMSVILMLMRLRDSLLREGVK